MADEETIPPSMVDIQRVREVMRIISYIMEGAERKGGRKIKNCVSTLFYQVTVYQVAVYQVAAGTAPVKLRIEYDLYYIVLAFTTLCIL